jgi:hypothetical protein
MARGILSFLFEFGTDAHEYPPVNGGLTSWYLPSLTPKSERLFRAPSIKLCTRRVDARCGIFRFNGSKAGSMSYVELPAVQPAYGLEGPSVSRPVDNWYPQMVHLRSQQILS